MNLHTRAQIPGAAVMWRSSAASILILTAATMLPLSFATQLRAGESSSAAESSSKVPQGGNLDSIKRLPNWSGTWESTSYKKHQLGHGRAPYRDLNPPFNDKVAPKFEEYKKIVYAGGNFPSRSDHCISWGLPGYLDGPGALTQFLFTPGLVTVVASDYTRMIYTDGRPHDEDLTSYGGNSIGHWERGGVLVVDTTALDSGNEFILGIAQGDNSHVIERIYLKDKDHLVDDVTLEAPEVLAKTYSYEVTYDRSKFPMTESDCSVENRDLDSKTGQQTFDLTPPPQ